jgi:hypothetical protein
LWCAAAAVSALAVLGPALPAQGADLPAPAIVSPLSGGTVDDDSPLLWSAVAGASRYEVQLCGDAACNDVLSRGAVPNLYSLLKKPLGTLHWRVAAVDAGGNRGAWSPVVRFTVAHAIAGMIYEDLNADNDAGGLIPRPGVRMRLYRDGGDNVPGNDDPLVTTTVSDKTGAYDFHPATAGVYWVAADPATFTPAAGTVSPGQTTQAEQTYGGAGALCLQLDGSILRRTGSGPCFAGRSTTADDPAHLAGARHVARVAFDGSVTGIDFGFSYNAVTSTADAPGAGTLRQFVINANAIRGPNGMRFTPVTRAPNAKWWTIRLTSPLPSLTDAGTTLDGTAYSIVDPKFAIDTNREVLLQASRHIMTGKEMQGPERPELEVILTGDRGIDAVAPAAIRDMALGGARANVVARSSIAIDRTAIGIHPDGKQLRPAGEDGVVVESGAARLNGLYISSQRNLGLAIRPGATLTATKLFITRSGAENLGAAISLASSDAVISDSFIFENDAPAIIIGGNESGLAERNIIRGSAVSHNRAGIVLAENAVGTVIEENDIVWNSEGGVIINPGPRAPARLTRISRNHYNENGGVPIDLQHQTEKLHLEPATCRTEGLANQGLGAPQVTSAEVQRISKTESHLIVEGKACPGAAIEIYQSFITGELREPIERERLPRDLPSVREAVKRNNVESRDNAGGNAVDIIPSVGEFNFAITVKTDAAGAFRAVIPIIEEDYDNTPNKPRPNLGENAVEMDVRDVFHGHRTYAVAAVAIDATGNTSEFSRRRIVGDRGDSNAR